MTPKDRRGGSTAWRWISISKIWKHKKEAAFTSRWWVFWNKTKKIQAFDFWFYSLLTFDSNRFWLLTCMFWSKPQKRPNTHWSSIGSMIHTYIIKVGNTHFGTIRGHVDPTSNEVLLCFEGIEHVPGHRCFLLGARWCTQVSLSSTSC